MGKINTDNYPNRPFSSYQDDDMFILQDNGGETYTTNVGDVKNLADSRIKLEGVQVNGTDLPISGKKVNVDISGKTDLSVIAYTFNSEMGYFKGAYVTYNGKLYEFIQEHTGAWNPSHVREIRASGQYVRAGNGGYNNGDRATCEGYMTKASGNYSHAEGRETQAEGEAAHAEGTGTIANSDNQHVEGKYNVADTDDKYAHIVGNGTSDDARSNALTLDWDGNLRVSGDIVDGNGDATVEGNPVTFDSPFEQDAKSVVVSVKPIQAGSGTPSPDNIRPISGTDEVEIGVSGKNLWNPNDTVNGFLDTDGSVRSYVGFSTTNYRKCVANETYTLSYYRTGVGDGSGMRIAWYDANKNFIRRDGDIEAQTVGLKQISATAPANAVYMRASMYTDVAYTENQQLERGSSATTYEPYNPNSHTTTIPLPSTLYGGTENLTDGSADSTHELKAISASDDIVFAVLHSGCDLFKLNGVSYKAEGNIISNMFKGDIDFAGAYSAYINSTGNVIFAVPTGLYNASQFKAFLVEQGCTICCELATPTTLSLTPTDVELLEGTNVVSTNAEKVAVTYGRSLWQDIDELKTDTEGKLDKSDVATIEGDTASKAYSVNEFMLRSDGFYKVTQPIAQNASITASNTTKTTVGEVLTALLNA